MPILPQGSKTCINLILQAVIQLMQHFKSYKSVPQISQLSDRITTLKTHLESSVFRELENG